MAQVGPGIYKGRNVVERFFNRVKEFRAMATRYDKHARNYRAGIVIAGIITHPRDQLCDTPLVEIDQLTLDDPRVRVGRGVDTHHVLADHTREEQLEPAQQEHTDDDGGNTLVHNVRAAD